MFKKLMKRFSKNCLYTRHIHKRLYCLSCISCMLLYSHVTYLLLSKQNAHPFNIFSQQVLFGEPKVSARRSNYFVFRASRSCFDFLCIYNIEVMYMGKQSSAILELLSPHDDVFCINSYKCSDYYHFIQVDQYIQLFCKGVRYNIMGVPNPRRS